MSLKAWGKRSEQLQNDVVYLLERVYEVDEAVGSLLWDTLTQGVGDAQASAGTHKKGWCADFSFRDKRWNRYMAHRVYKRLKPFFACAFRAQGEVSPSAHLHIALKAKENAGAIIAANMGDVRVHNRIEKIWTV